MTIEELSKSLKLKMTSGNSIPCDSCRITREEYELIDLLIENVLPYGRIKAYPEFLD